jgi:predicted RNA polymerase sigma factor
LWLNSHRAGLAFGWKNASADLVELDGLKQALEVGVAETVVALALDNLAENWPDHGLDEDLQPSAWTIVSALMATLLGAQRRNLGSGRDKSSPA